MWAILCRLQEDDNFMETSGKYDTSREKVDVQVSKDVSPIFMRVGGAFHHQAVNGTQISPGHRDRNVSCRVSTGLTLLEIQY